MKKKMLLLMPKNASLAFSCFLDFGDKWGKTHKQNKKYYYMSAALASLRLAALKTSRENCAINI